MLAEIASIVIKGVAMGTDGSGDHFGFVAERIGAFKAAGARLTLNLGIGRETAAIGATGDLQVREVV